MLEYFFPDYKYKSIQEIEPGFFCERNIRLAVLDIDNTLVPYTVANPTEDALAFLDRLRAEGVSYCFVSNNNRERVQLFNKELGAWYRARAGKPLKFGLKQALAHFGVSPEQAVLIGDQIFTDIWGAKRLGITSILVEPIEGKETPFFQVKRKFEGMVLRKYELSK